MINGFKVITLCGSTRFKNEFLEAQKRLTLEGNVVITVGLFGHSGDDVVWTEGVKDMLDRQHLAKIDLADEIFVINVGGYIGDSTRREIAYAEYKGKSITYLESCRKPSLYDNIVALGELHDAGRISDEDYEQAERDFDEKRNAAIAEYNACQGPWLYQWKNIDTVVCGILQQIGVVSIDYSDLKDLYDADRIYEVRIKGKGANDKEQLLNIINIIRNEYIAQLRTSKNIVVTLCGPSNPSDLLENLADCIDDMNIVWETRKKTEIEVSIVYCTKAVKNMEYETKMQKYDKWVSKVCSFLVEESKKLNVTCGTFQSKPILDKQPDVVFLGYNPNETGPVLTLEKIRKRFYEGNPYFYSADRKNKKIWRVWRYEDSFKWANFSTPVEDGHFIFFNTVYFGTNSIDEFEKNKGYKEVIDKCHEYTEEVIQTIFKPKCIVCFSVEDCFDRLNIKFHFQQVKLVNTEEETDKSILNEAQTICKPKWNYIYKCPWPIKKALWNNIPVYGIPHPSWPSLSLDDMGAIALYLKSEMKKLNI